MKKFIVTMLVACCVQAIFAQSQTISGSVVDVAGEPVIGATVQVIGTQNATVTDIDGNWRLNDVSLDAHLSITYIGMESVTIKGNQGLNVVLQDDAKTLDEVVTIGYGYAKAKDLTSPITVVRGEELTNVPSSSVMTAMQGKVPGMNVVSSGTPGSSPMVRIRGNGSFINGSPLYVVDGMFYDDISFLNTSDIKDMSVLKDASAAAIYGVRAANGVIIITTKKGQRNQSAQITYDGYIGIQKATNVLEMCNSSQYATMLLEADYDTYSPFMIASIDRYGGNYASSDFHDWTYGSDTDWYGALLRDAIITNHALNIRGGGDRATYSVGMSYLYQNGIMDVNNDYSRLNFRGALDYDATRWLKVGANTVYTKSDQRNPNTSALQQAFNAPGIYPIYDDNNTDAYPDNYASPSSVGFTNNFYNPIATANYYQSKNKTEQFLGTYYADITFIPEKLHAKSSISYTHQAMEDHVFIPAYYVSELQQQTSNSLSKSSTSYNNHVWDNTITYNDSWGQHNFGAIGGFSMRQESYRILTGSVSDIPEGKEEYYYVSNGDETSRTASDDGYTYRGISWFARLNYNYANKYYLMFTFRADGSSKYQEQWGYFPSVGVSWVASEENFMKDVKAVDFLKIRASWGLLGNDHVAASDGFASITSGNSASGVFGNTTIAGYQNNTYYSWLKWEEVEEFNVGFNLGSFNNHLDLDVDYYHRLTHDAVISVALPFQNTALAGNYGKILNQGIDVAATWTDRIGKDFKYHVGANLSFLWNEVKSLSGATRVTDGMTNNIVGEEMNSYYGYKVIGIYQNEEQIANDPIAVANGCEPGDFIYEDVNGDGVLDGDDRQVLGSYLPNFTYGVNFGFEYKGFDFEISTYGQTGAQMYNRKRALRYAQSNYNFDLAQYENRWTGEGSTNTDPSAAALIKGWNVSDSRVNSYFVESADYFRIQNVTLGYTLRKLRMGGYTLPSIRFSLTADRPLTIFSANTFTPEISDTSGWDTNVYPLTATYTFGVQIQF